MVPPWFPLGLTSFFVAFIPVCVIIFFIPNHWLLWWISVSRFFIYVCLPVYYWRMTYNLANKKIVNNRYWKQRKQTRIFDRDLHFLFHCCDSSMFWYFQNLPLIIIIIYTLILRTSKLLIPQVIITLLLRSRYTSQEPSADTTFIWTLSLVVLSKHSDAIIASPMNFINWF